jgi:hypothetical protein
MSQLSKRGNVRPAAGLDTLAVTGLNLPFNPTGASVNLRKPGINSENIDATIFGELTPDGFGVVFSSTIPIEGYVLEYEIWRQQERIESDGSLMVSYSELVRHVARFLGYSENLSESQVQIVDVIIQSGVRQFYHPPAVNGVEGGYEWSFMRPHVSMSLEAGKSTYTLPDGFGRLAGDFYFSTPAIGRQSIVLTSEYRINALAQQDDSPGVPRLASIRYKENMGQHGQAQEVTFYPTPVREFEIHFSFTAYTGRLSINSQYPLGGPQHSELVIESCLAIAEQRENDERGVHTERFENLLASAVADDKRKGAMSFGQMGSSEWGGVSVERQHRNGNVTYKGLTW